MIGVILKTVDAYVSFLSFRKQWYVPTKFILDARDIDSSIDYVVSDMPLSVDSPNLIIYGKDITRFEELSNYVDVSRSIPFGTQHIIEVNRLQAVLPDTINLDSAYEELCKDFADVMYDSRDIPGLDFPTDGLNTEEIERKKAETIASVLAQRAQEKRDKEEALRLEQERIKREEEERIKEEERIRAEKKAEEERLEAERKAEIARIEAEKREAELKAAKEEAEQLAIEMAHRNSLAEIQRQAEESKLRAELEVKRKELEEAERLKKLKEEQKILDLKKQAIENDSISDINANNNIIDNLINTKLIAPRINTALFNNTPKSGGLRIGRKSTNRRSATYIFAGAKKNCGSSTIAYNFAHSLAKINSNVLLIDLDFVDNDLTEWFNTGKLIDCGIDVPFKGMPFDKYLKDIDNYVTKISLGNRRLSFLNCRKIVEYSADNRSVLSSFDYMSLIKALSTRYTTIVVDIGCIAPIEKYQERILSSNDCKKFVCYGAGSTSDINESLRNVYYIKSDYDAVLSKAPNNINRITIEKAIKKPIVGVIYNSSRFYAGCNLLYEEDESNIKSAWSKFINAGGTL